MLSTCGCGIHPWVGGHGFWFDRDGVVGMAGGTLRYALVSVVCIHTERIPRRGSHGRVVEVGHRCSNFLEFVFRKWRNVRSAT